MVRTALAGLRAYPGRLVATLLAVTLGVGFVCGTMIFGDTVKESFFDQFARGARNVDGVVLPPAASAAQAGTPAAGTGPVVPADVLATVRAVPGVSSAEGRYTAPLALLDSAGRLVRNGTRVGYAISAGADPRLRPYELTGGRAPATPDEAAVDEKTAVRAHLTVGGPVTVLDTRQRRHRLTLVGTFRLSASSTYSGVSIVALAEATLVPVAAPTGYAEIVVRATPGTPPTVLADRIATALRNRPTGTGAAPPDRPTGTGAAPPDRPARAGAALRVVTGEQRRIDLAEEAIRDVDLLLLALSVFGLVALVVAAFVIFNTFTILLAQRIRELALLRCVGAGRRQIFGSVLLESALVGLLGGAAGVAVGIGVAAGLFRAFDGLGMALPTRPPVLRPASFLVALATGLAVTVFSAVVPAARATRIPPLAALRTDPDAGIRSVRGRWQRVAFSVLAVAAGGVASAAGAASPDRAGGSGPGSTAEMLVIGGGIVVFQGLLVALPLFIGEVTALLGALPGKLFGMPVRLATANGRRNPSRAAVTAATLAVGVGLMTVFSVMLASSSATFTAGLAAELPVDYGVEPADAGPTARIPAEVTRALRGRPEFDLVVGVHERNGTAAGRKATVGAVDRAGRDLLPAARTGDMAELRAGTAVLAEAVATAAGARVGDPITVTAGGRTARYRVVATVNDSPALAQVLLDPDEYVLRHGGGDAATPRSVLLRAAPGVRADRSRAAVEAVVAGYPLLSVRSVADYREEMTDQVNGLLGLFAGLLGVTFLIALVGIANTLSLSIVERTREFAVQRALGLTRGQLRTTLLVEALLLAAVGALVGVVFGVVYGALLTHASFTETEPVLDVPVGQVLGFVAVATVCGALAAVVPASRAQRVSIVAAMSRP